jgi:hypothetical protein
MLVKTGVALIGKGTAKQRGPALLRTGVATEPAKHRGALSHLGKACQAVGQLGKYLEYYRDTAASLPDPSATRTVFSEIEGAFVPTATNPGWMQNCSHCFRPMKSMKDHQDATILDS